MRKLVSTICVVILFACSFLIHPRNDDRRRDQEHREAHTETLEPHHGPWHPQLHFPNGNGAAMWNWMETNGVATEANRKRYQMDVRHVIAKLIPDDQFMHDALVARIERLGPHEPAWCDLYDCDENFGQLHIPFTFLRLWNGINKNPEQDSIAPKLPLIEEHTGPAQWCDAAGENCVVLQPLPSRIQGARLP